MWKLYVSIGCKKKQGKERKNIQFIHINIIRARKNVLEIKACWKKRKFPDVKSVRWAQKNLSENYSI